MEESMTVKVVVLQSNYLPWVGYFDLIDRADICVFYDDVQYTKNDWRNRNRIPTQKGLEWITVPVGQSISRLINQVEIHDTSWQEEHHRKITNVYRVGDQDTWSHELLQAIFTRKRWANLSELNQETIKLISRDYLKIETQFDSSINYDLEGKGEVRLLSLLSQLKATHYISGPAGKNYLHAKSFEAIGIELDYIDYPIYSKYEQIYAPFVPNASVIDLLLNTRDAAKSYLREQKRLGGDS
jgi:hypothetical protein